jgi:hypothetical protein
MANWTGVVVGIIGVVITCIALLFAIDERRRVLRTTVSTFMRCRRLAGEVRVVFSKCKLG